MPEGRDGRAPQPRSASASPPNRGRRFRWPLLLLVAALALPAWGAWQLRPVANAPAPTDFEVRPGWGGARIARELVEADLVHHAGVFEVWLRIRGLDRRIGEGLYELSPHLSAPRLAQRLSEAGRPRTTRLVIPEGFTAAQVASRFAEDGPGAGAEADAAASEDRETAFLNLVAAPGELAPPYLPRDAGLEGYLFPDTYELRALVAPRDAVATMVARFEQEVDVSTRRQLGRAGLSVHAWVTLASLVQAEAANDGEMAIIAGVFRNRLDRGMRLQSDPTVAYGLGRPMPEVSAADGDLQIDHPWNTYTRGGLPEGPIGNPGREALRAVLAPDRTAPNGEPWLYFLHGREDGRAVFRPNTTLDDHNADVERFLRP